MVAPNVCSMRAVRPARTAGRAGSVDAQSGTTTGEVVGSPPTQATGLLEMQKQNTTLATMIPDPSVLFHDGPGPAWCSSSTAKLPGELSYTRRRSSLYADG